MKDRIVGVGCVLLVLILHGIALANDQLSAVRSNIEAAAEAAERGDYAEAIRLVRRNQELDPNYWDYVRHEGRLLWEWASSVRQEKGMADAMALYGAALRTYDRAIRLAKDTYVRTEYLVSLYQQKSLILAEMGQLYEAILTLNEGYQLKPTEVSTNYLMGMFLAELSRIDEDNAKELQHRRDAFFAQAIANNTDHRKLIPYAYFYVGKHLYESEDAAPETVRKMFQLWLL